MYKDLSLKEKAKVLQYGGKLGLTSVEDIAKLYDDAIGHKFQTKGQMEVDVSNNHPTLNEYLAQRAAEEQKEYYLQGSRTRTTPKEVILPMTEESKQMIRDDIKVNEEIVNNWINNTANRFKITTKEAERLLYGKTNFDNLNIIPTKEDQDFVFTYADGIIDLNNSTNEAYSVLANPVYKGANCIATATSNNPNPGHYVTSNIIFQKNPGKYGFKKVEYTNIQPGGIIQHLDSNEVPTHAVILDSYNDKGKRLVNYSSGNVEYHKQARDFSRPDKELFYNFVGNHQDSVRWTNEYNQLYRTQYAKGGPIVTPYGQWKYPGRDTIIPSNNITMDNVNYPVLGVSNTGDTKIMMPWHDYKFRGSMVYEHPLIGNQFQLGGNTKPTFDQWYPTVPKQKNDTSSYDLRRAYNTLPFDEMEKFRTINDYHLPSVAYDEKTDTYTFLKRNGHPTLNYELDWYNSGSPDAQEFRRRYKLDTLSQPWRYIPRTFQIGGLAKKSEPIYNENGQVIGRRYVNKDNSKIIDSVVPQGRVNFQEFQKAKGKKARATNFEDLEQFQDSLIARGYNEPQRLAFLATSYNEMDNKGAASRGIGGNGYMGFNKLRMPLSLLNDSSKQIQYILDDTEKLTPDNWTDGGSGGPYIKNQTDAFNKFWNETNPNTATLVLNKANVRPAKQSDWYLRASDADLMKQYIEYPELPKEEEQKQKKSNKLLDSFVDFILSGGLQNTPSYADGGNLFKKGGIYIKPENRGKFTALKKRTGHSASWFKAHGTPAQKKMATFALNARKWNHKHDEGGYLYSEGGFLLAPYLYNE